MHLDSREESIDLFQRQSGLALVCVMVGASFPDKRVFAMLGFALLTPTYVSDGAMHKNSCEAIR